MAKLLLLVLIGVVVYTLWKKAQSGPRPASPSGRANPAPEAMLECARCGVHFPAGEAVMRDGKAYCSAAHAQARTD